MRGLPAKMGHKGYLLRDIFSEHHAAGAVHGTMANDRINQRTVVDTYATTQMVLNPGFETSGTNGGLVSGTRTVNRARTAGVATIEATAHGLVNGNVATIASMTDATYNAASVVVTRIDNDHFTYACVGLDEVETVDAAGVITTDVMASWSEIVATGALLSKDATVFHGGSYSLKLTRVTANGSEYQVFPVIPGITYTLTGWDYGDGTNAGRVRIYDTAHSIDILAAISTGHTAAAWAQFSYPFTVPAGCVQIYVYLYTPDVNGSFCYFDDVSLLPTTGLLQISHLWDALGLQNRVYNGGFEIQGAGGADVFAGWTEVASDGAIARTTTAGEFRSGVAACKLTSGATMNTYVREPTQVIPGIEYTATFWTRGDGVNAGRYLIYDDTNAALITPLVSTGITAAAYGSVSVNFIAPNRCVSAVAYAYGPAANGGIAYFDDITVVQATVSAERRLVCLGGKATAAFGDPGLWYPRSEARVAGKSVVISAARNSGGDLLLGWDSNTSGVFSIGFDWNSVGLYLDALGVQIGSLTSTTEYLFAVILRSTGHMLFIKGGAFTTWTLMWVSGTGNTTPLYPDIGGHSSVAFASKMLIPSTLWLPTPLASDSFNRADGALGSTSGDGHAEGVAGSLGNGGSGMAWTNQIGTTLISANTAIPNALVGGVAIATVASTKPKVIHTAKLWRAAGNPGLVLSYVDADNYLRAVRTAANTQLIQRVATVETTLVNVAQAYSAGAELRVVLDGAYCAVYYNNVLAGSTAAIPAALQVSAVHGMFWDDTTAGNIIDDLYVYPRDGFSVPE